MKPQSILCFCRLELVCTNQLEMYDFFSKFVHTHCLQLEDGSGSGVVVIAGLLRFSKTVSANIHLAPINGDCMIFFRNLSIPNDYNWKMVLVQEQL